MTTNRHTIPDVGWIDETYDLGHAAETSDSIYEKQPADDDVLFWVREQLRKARHTHGPEKIAPNEAKRLLRSIGTGSCEDAV